MITGVSLSVGEPYKKEMTYEFTRDFKVDTQPSGDCDGTSDYGAGRTSAGLPCVTDWECKDAVASSKDHAVLHVIGERSLRDTYA